LLLSTFYSRQRRALSTFYILLVTAHRWWAPTRPKGADSAQAMAEAYRGIDATSLPPKEIEYLTLVFLHLWNDTARSYQLADPFPQALLSEIRTVENEEVSLKGAVEMAEGFKVRFSLRKPPKGFKFDRTRSWLRDVASEANWCRGQLQEMEQFKEEYPEAEDRKQAIWTALSWIEECMGWTALYAGMDAEIKRERRQVDHGKNLH